VEPNLMSKVSVFFVFHNAWAALDHRMDSVLPAYKTYQLVIL
jgi:hypothetical protein